MDSKEIRKRYLDFFVARGHKIIPSASLIPENDPTALFTTAGMQPLSPYLMGEAHPMGKRLVSAQKCIRTGDIDEVGDNRHNTFFEMLGNWSLGDYFKKEAIQWSFDFLTLSKEEGGLGMDKRKLAVSVFAGDEDAERDEESADLWRRMGIAEDKIAYLGKEDNWWGPVGEMGPSGPDTEIFYWVGEGEYPPEDSNPGSDSDNWLEIWNNVFMEYDKQSDGTYIKMKQKNVDTGMGLERTVMVISQAETVFETDLLAPVIKKIEELSVKKYEDDKKFFRVVADHTRAAVMILGDENGIAPSNTGAGYVLRRLIRRTVRFGKKLGLKDGFAAELAEPIFNVYGEAYPEIIKNKNFVLEELRKEEEKFEKTLEKGLKEFEKGVDPFVLFTTYGFPLELTKELAEEKGEEINEERFWQEFKKHQELSRTASAGQFKGGLADHSEETKRLHTAAHLMLEAWRRVLGSDVSQKGSNITPERLRFDISYPEKISAEDIKKVEEMVNEQIRLNQPVKYKEMSLEEAKEMGAVGVFDNKYDSRVKVYLIGEEGDYFSKEICGGPHVDRTGELGEFKIIKEEASGAGVRRVKAVLI